MDAGSRVKRSEDDLDGVGKGGKGTNIARVQVGVMLLFNMLSF